MKEYNTYQEAKIAHPRSDIYTRLGKFAPGEMPCEMHERWEKCEPQDYLLSVSGFINDGYKITAGDLYIDIDGRVEEMSKSDEDSNQIDPIDDDKRYVLRANVFKRKIPTESPEEREALDMIDTTSKQVESLAKGDVVEWKNGDECMIRGEKLIYIGESIESDIHCVQELGTCLYRNAHISVIEKPESQEQKAECELLESAYDLYIAGQESLGVNEYQSFQQFIGDRVQVRFWLGVAGTAGYRRVKQ